MPSCELCLILQGISSRNHVSSSVSMFSCFCVTICSNSCPVKLYLSLLVKAKVVN